MTTPLGLATCARLPDLSPDCQLLVEPLRDQGFRPFVFDWRSESPEAPVLIRSTWDYYRHREDFVTWAHGLSGPLFNPAEIIAWNSDKHYLGDLAAKGADVVPSRFLPRADRSDIETVLAEEGWDEAVVKPTISAAAWRTVRLEAGRTEDVEPWEVPVIVQPFLPEVQTDGEWSLLFFEGEFSHLVLKRPKAGDFRVQKEHGGSVEVPATDPALVEAGRTALERAGLTDLVYARIDGVVSGGRFLLMELELIEPELFFRADPDSPHRLATILRRRIEQ